MICDLNFVISLFVLLFNLMWLGLKYLKFFVVINLLYFFVCLYSVFLFWRLILWNEDVVFGFFFVGISFFVVIFV